MARNPKMNSTTTLYQFNANVLRALRAFDFPFPPPCPVTAHLLPRLYNPGWQIALAGTEHSFDQFSIIIMVV